MNWNYITAGPFQTQKRALHYLRFWWGTRNYKIKKYDGLFYIVRKKNK